MAIQVAVDKHKRRIEASLSGEVSIDEIRAAIDAAVRHPDFEPGFDVLSDHTRIRKAITTAQMEAMVAHLESLSTVMGGARWAIVTTKTASYGMMRMLSVRIQEVPMTVAVFRKRDEAEGWLAAPRPGGPR